QLLPVPGHRLTDQSVDLEIPAIERRARRRSGREHRVVVGQVLAGRNALPVRVDDRAAPPDESASDELIAHRAVIRTSSTPASTVDAAPSSVAVNWIATC